ncbi:MAG: RusA family crossover junction endodeoxyribonuclease [Desulfuromonadaceae bacterium]|nr:RusA family crossover junction endodeoxyribonuclease [Desulfuromonadaceae bacterium]
MSDSVKKIEFFIPGKPVAQSRPRFARRGAFVATYDAAPAKDYKSWVKSCALDHMEKASITMISRDIPLIMTLVVDVERPKTKKNVAFPTTKPDCDNFAKGVMDALESILYQADQQIVRLVVSKHYSDRPGVTVTISEAKC